MMTVDDDNYNYNMAVWIVAASFMGVQLIYMVINTILFCIPRCRKHICCKVHAIVYESIFLCLAISMLSLTAVNFGRIYPKSVSLSNWSEYADCVDDYMQIN